MKVYELLFAYALVSFTISVPITSYFLRYFINSGRKGWNIAELHLAIYLLKSSRPYLLIPVLRIWAKMHYVLWGIMFFTIADIFVGTNTFSVPVATGLETVFGVLNRNDQNLFLLCTVLVTYGVIAFATVMNVVNMISGTKLALQTSKIGDT